MWVKLILPVRFPIVWCMSRRLERHHRVNVGVCALTGHMTYAPTEANLSERLSVVTVQGVAWRCLRCGDYILGEPVGSGLASDAPVVPRGKLLRDLWIMRFFAVERAAKGILLLLLAVLVWDFQYWQGNFTTLINQEQPLLVPVGDVLGWNINHWWLARLARGAAEMTQVSLVWLAVGLLLYALVEFGEAVGLFLAKRWGEYFAVVATSFLLPLEVYELYHHVSGFKIIVFVINIFLIVWLVWTKRLFGVRGGHKAYMVEHHEDSLLTVERASKL